MNISCISCPARYGVPDAKLVGKRVRVTCKRCGAILLVDGTMSPPRVSSGANVGPSVAPVARTSLSPTSSLPAAPKPVVEFLVVMPDDRQQSADVAQIVRLYRDQQINAESLVWREGMAEWKPVWEVEEIASAFRRMGYVPPAQPAARASQPAQAHYDDGDDASTHVVPSSPPPAATDFDDEDATSIVDSSRIPFDAPLPSYSQRSEDEDPTGVVPSPMELAFALPAAAERRARTARRAAPEGLDLFTRQAERAAEPEPAPPVEDEGARLTGARGENSVLFSLDQLVKQEQQKQRPVVMPRARTDESVLVDSSPSLPSEMGSFPLVAPDFTAPVSAPPPMMTAAMGDDFGYPEPKKRGWVWPVFAIVLLGALAGGWFSGKLQPLLAAVGVPIQVPTKPSAEPAASVAPATKAEATPSAAPSAAPEASAAASALAAASASTAPSAKPSPPPAAVAATPRPSSPKEPTPETTKPDEPPAPAESAAKPAAGGGGDFDPGAAKTALTAAASNAASCKEPGGPTGSGKVSITFAPSGRPTSVAVTGELAGTTVGSCVARLFRAARVPAFSGEPVSVSKSFSVQ